MPASRVRIEVVGSRALRELQGLTRGSSDVARSQQRAASDVEKAARRAAEAKAREADKAAKAEARAAARAQAAEQRALNARTKAQQKAAAEEMRLADREAKHWQQVAERARAVRDREEKAATAAVRREADKRVRIAAQEAAKRGKIEEQSRRALEKETKRKIRASGGASKVLAAAAVAGGITAAGTARGVAGVADLPTRIQRANEFKKNLIITGADAGLTPEQTGALQNNILRTAKATGTDPTEIMSGLQIAHEQFNSLKLFAGNIESIARAAKASGSSVEDFVGMMGSAQQAYGLSGDQMKEAMDILIAGAKEGAISIKDFAGPMAAAMGIHSMNTGQKGIEGVRQFVGLMQGVGAGQFGAEETETRATQFVSQLNRKEVKNDLRSIGIKIPKKGPINLIDVVDQLATNKHFQTPEQRQGIFHDKEAREAVETLIAQRKKVLEGQPGAVDLQKMHDVSAETGAKSTDQKMKLLEEAGVLEMDRKAVEMQADTIAHLSGFNDQILKVTDAANTLEQALGRSALWLDAIGVGGAAGAAYKLLAPAPGVQGPAALGAAESAGGVAAGGLGTAVVSVLGAGVVGAGAGVLIDEIVRAFSSDNKGLSDMLADAISEDLLKNRDTFDVRITNPDEVHSGDPTKMGLDVNVKVEDTRTTVTTRTRTRLPTVNVTAGPLTF